MVGNGKIHNATLKKYKKTIYSFALERLGNPVKANVVLSCIDGQLETMSAVLDQNKDLQLQLCVLADRLCDQIVRQRMERWATVDEFMNKVWSTQEPYTMQGFLDAYELMVQSEPKPVDQAKQITQTAEAVQEEIEPEAVNDPTPSPDEDFVETIVESTEDHAEETDAREEETAPAVESQLENDLIDCNETDEVSSKNNTDVEEFVYDDGAEPAQTSDIKDLAEDPDANVEEDDEDEPEGFSFWNILAMSACGLLMLWMLAGLLMALGVIPMLDLGYTWFNSHILSVF